MDWASSLFVALIMTDITGTIFFLFGRVFIRLAHKDVMFARLINAITLTAYLVPFVYIVLYAVEWVKMDRNVTDFNFFFTTPLLQEASILLGCMWISLSLALLGRSLFRKYRWVWLCRGNIPEEEEAIERLFAEICEEFGIAGKVSLCRNDLIGMPCITQYHGYVVMLPLVHYTEQEAKVIFYHELCHYLNKDLYLKSISGIVGLLHIFNPVAHILVKEMKLLNEECCDRAACKKGSESFDSKGYFKVIDKLLTDGDRGNGYWSLAAADDRSNYERRVESMANYHKHGGLKRGTVLVLALTFLLGSSITSLAAGDGVADAYQGLVKETRAKSTNDGSTAEEEAVRILSKAFDVDPDKVIIMEEEIEPYLRYKQVRWTVPADTICVSLGMDVKEGDVVCVSVEGTPDTIEYETGLKDPYAIMWYVTGSGYIHEDFTIKTSGTHYFYVYNYSETESLKIDALITRPDP